MIYMMHLTCGQSISPSTAFPKIIFALGCIAKSCYFPELCRNILELLLYEILKCQCGSKKNAFLKKETGMQLYLKQNWHAFSQI